MEIVVTLLVTIHVATPKKLQYKMVYVINIKLHKVV